MVEPPGTAPGSDPLITSAFMSIAPREGQGEYKRCGGGWEGGGAAPPVNCSYAQRAEVAESEPVLLNLLCNCKKGADREFIYET